MKVVPDKILQQKVSNINTIFIKSLHEFGGVPKSFKPWECGLSPSVLYMCSLTCRKRMGFKTPEVKLINIKRWVTVASNGIKLPPGVFLSIKRKETFSATPKPHFDKKEYVLVMLPYGNMWSQLSDDIPITEKWLFTEMNKMTNLELLMRKDAAHPLIDYFKLSYDSMLKNKDQLWIHLKRRKKDLPQCYLNQLSSESKLHP